jgi:hypothetical protein
MSIHAKLSPEAEARLAAQRRNSSISSAIISLLVIVIIGLALGLVFLPSMVKETPVIVTYQSNEAMDKDPEPEKVKTTIQKKPTSPSSSAVKVIAATTVSTLSIPVPDAVVDVQAVDFGDGNDFGSGWGDGIGFGSGGGATFFNQSVKADRIAYVIDYSLSMKGERDQLMREELTKSVGALKSGTKFQMIYFSGPAWVAGSEMPGFNHGTGMATVKGEGGQKYEWTGKGLHDWTPKGKRQPVDWLDVTAKQMGESLSVIKDTRLSGGTDWENPLLMAFDMDPPPQIVFFMTDGAVGGRDMLELTKDLASIANKKGIVVNTVAMMEPKAEAPMADLAERTGGQFTIIGKDGKAQPGMKAAKGKKK